MQSDIEKIFKSVLDASFEVHKNLGPGLLESVYRRCLLFELQSKNIKVETEKVLPVYYKDKIIEAGYRIDLLVEDSIIIEIKAIEKMNNLFEAQIMSYMKLSKIKLGLLVNFNTKLLKDGIKRIIM